MRMNQGISGYLIFRQTHMNPHIALLANPATQLICFF